ncbi:MAG TPA: DUF3467 domain-containing protein [Ktedonobacteraceae bacterium]|nr:DUF3467 domain-containing protein [Ktedonobacteraceae bacterium]
MSEAEQRQQPTDAVNVAIEWYIPDDIQSKYASNAYVQVGEYEFTLSFFETFLPIFSGSPEENRAKIEQLGSIPAKCVARVVVSPELVPKLIQALQTGLDGYLTAKKLLEER